MIARFFLPISCLFFSLSSCGQNGVVPVEGQVTTNIIVPTVDTLPKKVRSYTRFEREILRFEENDKIAPPPTGSILFVGSSSIRLWRTLTEDMAPLPVVNRGFGGATIGEVNYYFHRMVAKYKPSFIVFYAGENDLFSPDISVDSVVNDFNGFRDSVNIYLPQCQAFFISVKPSPARWLFQDKFVEANNRFRAICEADPRWTYIDVVTPMLMPSGLPKKDIYRADSLHMNAAGYTYWTQVVKPRLKQSWSTTSKAVPKAN